MVTEKARLKRKKKRKNLNATKMHDFPVVEF